MSDFILLHSLFIFWNFVCGDLAQTEFKLLIWMSDFHYFGALGVGPGTRTWPHVLAWGIWIKFYYPLLEKFVHFSNFLPSWVFHFQVQGLCLVGVGGVVCTYISPKGVGLGVVFWAKWDPIWAKWDPSGQFVRCAPLRSNTRTNTTESRRWLACFHWTVIKSLFLSQRPNGRFWQIRTRTHSLPKTYIYCGLDRLVTHLLERPSCASWRYSWEIFGAARHAGPALLVGLGLCLLRIGRKQSWAAPTLISYGRAEPPESLALHLCWRIKGAKRVHKQSNCVLNVPCKPDEVYASASDAYCVNKANNCCSCYTTNMAKKSCQTNQVLIVVFLPPSVMHLLYNMQHTTFYLCHII